MSRGSAGGAGQRFGFPHRRHRRHRHRHPGLGDALGGSYLAWIALNGVVYLVAGAIGGAITVSVLIRLLRRSAAAPASESLAGAR